MSEQRLRELVIDAIGGIEQVKRVAELPDLPKKLQPDKLRELARYLLEEEHDDE